MYLRGAIPRARCYWKNMPIQTPFHARTQALCESFRWKQWAGYYAVCSYDTSHDREYFAIRHGSALIDVTPLFKYEVKGKDAAAFLSRVTVKDCTKLKVGQVTYTCWCDDNGKVLDDGTVTRLTEDHFRVTAAEPSYYWFTKLMRGFDVTFEESTDRIATLAVQGPTSRDLLKQVTDIDLDKLTFFKAATGRIDQTPVTITRTGYTGDLGYEVWVENQGALPVWDAIANAGRNYGAEAVGLDAMDVSRIEAGFIMNGVDYLSANHASIESRKWTPDECGLSWCVNLEPGRKFVGSQAIERERAQGIARKIACIEVDWLEIETLFNKKNLPPGISSSAWRCSIPVLDPGQRQVGWASSGAFSPILKKKLAMATLEAPHFEIGSDLKFEITVEHERHFVSAKVVESPQYNPVRKKLNFSKTVGKPDLASQTQSSGLKRDAHLEGVKHVGA